MAIVAKDTGEFIKCCGIIYDPERSEPEIIYGFGQRWWGARLRQVVPAMLAYGLKQCGLRRVLATIAPENLASVRVVQEAGMVFDWEEIETDGYPSFVYFIEPKTPAPAVQTSSLCTSVITPNI
ncbi:hypothetical protein DP113_10810 [Brasilonema octagenarum UFV-E1]|uniref:N-acetyltransferase domain-containing protein n=2 Tax=Brasilonema TaxID=383614 RepID=A0A856MB03_9CYAN|nr:GNAT family N-acetyltransferase [Brasilonema octagenarum]NMF63336.1 hypothetical protein [Brasilonema octagenarum UFV-OR1]QDL08333.1 hypothetical protein DP114_10870 [Brasilonema sennae CENA114]QDL14688.1 hypothetical protein DP113_10810 [Brasilonema octagenarum UFV-E1]